MYIISPSFSYFPSSLGGCYIVQSQDTAERFPLKISWKPLFSACVNVEHMSELCVDSKLQPHVLDSETSWMQIQSHHLTTYKRSQLTTLSRCRELYHWHSFVRTQSCVPPGRRCVYDCLLGVTHPAISRELSLVCLPHSHTQTHTVEYTQPQHHMLHLCAVR